MADIHDVVGLDIASLVVMPSILIISTIKTENGTGEPMKNNNISALLKRGWSALTSPDPKMDKKERVLRHWCSILTLVMATFGLWCNISLGRDPGFLYALVSITVAMIAAGVFHIKPHKH